MKYRLQQSKDYGETWEDTDTIFKSKKEVQAYVDNATKDYSVYDWRAGWNYALRRDSNGDVWQYHVVPIKED